MFYIGQEVVAIKDHSQGLFKKGDEFIIKDLQKADCKCSHYIVDIGMTTYAEYGHCGQCNTSISIKNNTAWFNDICFAPKIDLSEFTSESLIEELEQELVNV